WRADRAPGRCRAGEAVAWPHRFIGSLCLCFRLRPVSHPRKGNVIRGGTPKQVRAEVGKSAIEYPGLWSILRRFPVPPLPPALIPRRGAARDGRLETAHGRRCGGANRPSRIVSGIAPEAREEGEPPRRPAVRADRACHHDAGRYGAGPVGTRSTTSV